MNKITLTGLEEDTEYVIRVRAQTSVGFGPYCAPYEVKTISSSLLQDPSNSPENQESNNILILIVVGVAGGVVLILILFTLIRYNRSRKLLCLDLSNRKPKPQQIPLQNGTNHHSSMLDQQQPLIGKMCKLRRLLNEQFE